MREIGCYLISQGKSIENYLQIHNLKYKMIQDCNKVKIAMIQAGVSNPPDNLVNWVSNKFTGRTMV